MECESQVERVNRCFNVETVYLYRSSDYNGLRMNTICLSRELNAG